MKMEPKTKRKRIIVGDMLKAKAGSSSAPYIKVSQEVTLRPGDIISVESKGYQLQSLEAAKTAGKISDDLYETRKEQIGKTPDFVMGKLIFVPKATS